jgi:DNA topoisomerase-1
VRTCFIVRALEKLRSGGIRRLGTPRTGFRYVTADGRPLPRPQHERIRAQRLPPAWTDVHVSALPAAKLQAVGRDRAGRWQYRYHPGFAARRASAKYRRLLRFAGALPRLRAAVARDLRRRALSRERVLAAMVAILERCHMRPGSEAYLRENGSYGLTTVRARHVRVARDLVEFDYRGKSGQRQVRGLRDRRIARLVRELLRVPGRDVFKFVEGGEVVDVRRRHLNAYIRAACGAPFTAKDFRTWAGTLLCASALAEAQRRAAAPGGPLPSSRARPAAAARGAASPRRIANAVLRDVAARLGNTPAVARAAYVSPAVLEGFARGRVIAACLAAGAQAPARGLLPAERALATFLREWSPGPRRPSPLRLLRGGPRAPARARPAGPAAKPLRRAARGPERE